MSAGYRHIVSTVNTWITERPRSIILVFLLLTAVFSTGLADITTDPDIDAFTEDLEEQAVLDQIEQEFEPPFEEESSSVQVIQRGQNVLSKQSQLQTLELQHELEQHDEIEVEDGTSVANTVAQVLDPTAETTEEQINAFESASDAEVRESTRFLLGEVPDIERQLSEDRNREEPWAAATLTVIALADQPDQEAEIRQFNRAESVSQGVDGEFVLFSGALIEEEFETAMVDSLTLSVPIVSALILLFLIVAYRDPIDLLLGLVSLVIAVIWTFGFTGLANIPFTQLMVAVPPLLLAVGVDFGIHAVNRYREERVAGYGIREGMFRANEQLLIAFFIVTGTTAIGFGANLTSDLAQLQEFGAVTAVGIVFTLLVFGVFMPATKVVLDEFRDVRSIPEFGTTPLGDEDSALGRILPVGLIVSRRAPVVVLAFFILLTGAAGYVATDVETEFDDEDFLPYEEIPPHVDVVPGVVDTDDYRATERINILGDTFETGDEDQITVYVEGRVDQDTALESSYRAGNDPPGTFVVEDGRAVTESILDPIEAYADDDEEFAQLVAESDTTGNGVPDRNVDVILDELFASPYADDAAQYVTEDRSSMRVIYDVEAGVGPEEVTEDGRDVAGDYRQDATVTGESVVIATVTQLLFESAIFSLAIALGVAGVFLVIVYWVLERRPLLGLANLVPIVTTVAVLAATMVLLNIPFNALTATILSITIGIGIAYSVHITHRFIDEFNRVKDAETALFSALRGTGGGVTGSMVTTTIGVAALSFSVTPLLVQFALLTSLSVVYSYLAAMLVLPPTLLVWEQVATDSTDAPTDAADRSSQFLTEDTDT